MEIFHMMPKEYHNLKNLQKKIDANGCYWFNWIGSEILLFFLFVKTAGAKDKRQKAKQKRFTKMIVDEDVDFNFLKENRYGVEGATQAVFLAYRESSKKEEEKDVKYREFVGSYLSEKKKKKGEKEK